LLTDPFGRGWLPQDYTYNGGKNARTGMDLAGQYARGVMHKSGQFLYPILTAEKQQAFQTQQALPDGGFSWKYGGSSPSYDDAAVLPGRTQDEYIAVFRKTGGGMTDLRAAWAVTVGQEDGRSVITEVADCAQQDYTKSDLFKLYYNSALPQPTLPEGADHFNGAPLDRLYEPLTAAQAVFGWLGETAFTAELESSDENTAVVRLHFADNSPSVDVQMCKTDGYWLPDGLALQTEGVFRATAGDTPLPVGQTVRQAIAAAGGNVPLLQAGDKIELLFDPAPNGSVTIEDAVIRADGALQYSERETKRSTFDFTHAGTASLSYDYVAEPIMAQYLSSALTGAVYRGVTVSYPLADGTERTAAFVFRLANGARQDAAIHAADYHDPTYGYTLTLPDCFVEQGYAVPTENGVRFGLQNAMPGYSDDPTDAGTVMTLTAEATAVLKAQFGEDWLAEYPMPCKQLAERDGLTWYLIFASDVQYDPTDADIAAAYREMDQAARALDGSALSFEGQNAQQRTNAREQLLTGLAQYHGGLFRQKSEQTLAPVIRMAVTANADGNYADVAYEIPILRDGYPAQLRRKAERMWFDAAGSLAPTRREELADSGMKGMTMAGFLACYQNDLGMPIYDAEQVEALQRLYEDSSAEAYALLDTPEKGAKYALGLADAHGSFAGEAVYSPSDPCMVTFAFVQPDTNTPTGETLRIRMRPVAVDGSRPAVWLPEDFSAQGADGQTIGGLGYQFPPYDSRVYARAHQYYAYRDTADLVWYLDMGWTDGAYTEGVLAELEKRWKNDPQTVDSIVQRGGENVRALWASHKAVNPDIFGA
ncbi:MAG: hypothetical protein ACOYIE_09770, partial [Agathobaculum sp.]|uniref:hypothetical protein n=1 Tax=Agathobaculum sp. TaxID=2048138 RepID=UPI003D91545A